MPPHSGHVANIALNLQPELLGIEFRALATILGQSRSVQMAGPHFALASERQLSVRVRSGSIDTAPGSSEID
jgi:hypothetical protein